MSAPEGRVPAELVWEPYDGVATTTDHLSCDLSGHFWATVERAPEAWAYPIWDYQNHVMLSGLAPTVGSAQAEVEAWDREARLSSVDPEREDTED